MRSLERFIYMLYFMSFFFSYNLQLDVKIKHSQIKMDWVESTFWASNVRIGSMSVSRALSSLPSTRYLELMIKDCEYICIWLYRAVVIWEWASQVVQWLRNLPANRGDSDSIPGSGRSPGEGNSNPLQYSCLKNPMDREAWQVAVHQIIKSWFGHDWVT